MSPDTTMVEIRQDEVLTGEAVALDVQPVGFFLRALGVFIDMLLGIVALVLCIIAGVWLLNEGIVDTAAVPILLVTVIVLITVVIPTVVETATRGRSLGKLVVGGRIVRTDGGATGFRHAFIRSLVGFFELWLTIGSVAAIVAAFTPRAQRLGDLLAGTYSERTRAPKLPADAPGIPAGLEDWAAVADVGRLPDNLARRLARFARSAGTMEASARARLAEELATEVKEYVAPLPPVPAEVMLRAVGAVRTSRQLVALQGESARTSALTAGALDARGFPRS